jgi:multiple sugar transport system permease protein
VWDVVFAGSVISTIPVLLVFLIFQKYFVRGIALTGMK